MTSKKTKEKPILKFRKATERDMPALVEMGKKLWPYEKGSDLRRVLKKTLLKKNDDVLIVLDAKKAIAFATLSLRKDYVEGSNSSPVAYVEGIFVEPKYRKHGVGKQIVILAEEWGKSRGCSELGSDTESWNRGSQKFHESIGFKKAETIVHFIRKIA